MFSYNTETPAWRPTDQKTTRIEEYNAEAHDGRPSKEKAGTSGLCKP